MSVSSLHSRSRNLQKGLHSRICLPPIPTLPTSIFIYSILPSCLTKNHIFCAFMDVVTNSSTLRACSFRYKVHSIIIKNLLGEYYSRQLSRTRQEKEPLAETNNPNQITRWAQERLGLRHGNQTYTDWELLTACKIRVLSNTSYAHLKSEYGIPHSTLKRYLEKNLSTTSV